MTADRGAVRIQIATTAGPVDVLRITEEDPDVSSVVCLQGKAQALPISRAYHEFVQDPTGVIQRDFSRKSQGRASFRVDVSRAIEDGYSWQLGLYLAHAAQALGRLAGPGDGDAPVIVATGEVTRDLDVLPVSHVAEKLAHLSDQAVLIVPSGSETPAVGHSVPVSEAATVAEALALTGLGLADAVGAQPRPDDRDETPEQRVPRPSPPTRPRQPEDAAPPALEPRQAKPNRSPLVLFGLFFVICAAAAFAYLASGPTKKWADALKNGEIADLIHQLESAEAGSEPLRAKAFRAFLAFQRPASQEITLSLRRGKDRVAVLAAEGPEGVHLTVKVSIWRLRDAGTSLADDSVKLASDSGRLDWIQPDPIARGARQTIRAILLASQHPITGREPWFPYLYNLEQGGSEGDRAGRIKVRLARAGVVVKIAEIVTSPGQ